MSKSVVPESHITWRVVVPSTRWAEANDKVDCALEDRYSFEWQLWYKELVETIRWLGEPYECSASEIEDLMKHDVVTAAGIENTHYSYIAFTIQGKEDGMDCTTILRVKMKPQVSIKLK